METLQAKRSFGHFFSLNAPGSGFLTENEERELQKAVTKAENKRADRKRVAAEQAAAAGLAPNHGERLLSKSTTLLRSSTTRVIHKARSSSHIPRLSGSDISTRPSLALDTSRLSIQLPQIPPLDPSCLAVPASAPPLAHQASASPLSDKSSTPRSATAQLSPWPRQRTPESPLAVRNVSLPSTLTSSTNTSSSTNATSSTSSTTPSEPPTPSTVINLSWHSSPVSESTPTMATAHRKDSDAKSTLSPSDAIHSFSTASVARGGISYASSSTTSATTTTNASQTPASIHAAVQDQCAKRIQTLAYLKRAHEGRLYWFNTLHFSQSELLKLPSFQSPKLARRATNFLLLGLSLPGVLEVKSSGPLEYLRTLHALLVEYDTYIGIHPADGSGASSLSRARLPQMFRRAGHGASTKGRRTSSAADIGLPMSASAEPGDTSKIFPPAHANGHGGATSASANAAGSVSFAPSEQELLKGEEYAHLLTPSLPFDPDFFETFATLCDILIECYARIVTTVSSPEVCVNAGGGLGLGDVFTKVDAKLRKVIVQGLVKDFEDASKAGVRAEVGGVGKVVLGGML